MSIGQNIRKLSQRADEVYSLVAKVTKVDEAARVCSVEPVNGDAAIFDVRLQAQESGADGVVLIPALHSWVVVTFLSKETAYVAKCSQVDKVIWTVEKQNVEFTKDGFSLKSEQANFADQVTKMLDTMDALIQTLTEFQLATNMGPTIAVMPQIITKLTQHKADFNQVRTDLKTMLY